MLRPLGYRPRGIGVCSCETVLLYDVYQLRGLSALSGEQFPPTLCGRVGEATPHY